jgi:microcystin degradation protein MlrC
MRIFAVGLATETNTFAPFPAGWIAVEDLPPSAIEIVMRIVRSASPAHREGLVRARS